MLSVQAGIVLVIDPLSGIVTVSHSPNLSKRTPSGGWAAMFKSPKSGDRGDGGVVVDCVPLPEGDALAVYQRGGAQVPVTCLHPEP